MREESARLARRRSAPATDARQIAKIAATTVQARAQQRRSVVGLPRASALQPIASALIAGRQNANAEHPCSCLDM